MFASFCSIGFRGALLVLFGAHVVQAQDHATVGAATGIGSVRGRLVDSATTRPITNGSVTIRREADTSFAGGALPGADGSFRVESLTPGRYTVRVRALGFAPTVRTGITISTDAPVADLGAIGLAPVAARITELVITADQQDVTLAPDRNSYSTKNMTTASGGTAVDVLRNVPSVEVDGSNKVSLRGNENVVVQINGSSSPLHGEQLGNFLAQLPASTIARVEVATNPSAKNDPEGTAGIINIVLEQRVELGLSGGVTASTGTTGLATLSGNIGQQRGPWTLFASYSFFRDSRTVIGHRDLTNLVLSDPAFVFAHLNASSSPLSQNLILRSEYRVDEHDVLSADAVILGGDFARKSVANYTDFNASRDVIGLFDQFNTQHSRNGLEDYAVAFRRTGRPDASTFSAELHATRANSTANVELFGLVHQADSSTSAIAGPRERDVTSAQYPLWNLQTDYTHPFGAHAKLESGLKGTLRHTTNDFTAANLDSLSGQFVLAPERTTAFDYREQIGAGYMVLSQQLGKAQTQAGLRLEQATTRLTLAGTSQPSDTRYASAFPSAIVSYNLTEMHQIKLSYSRRITRPDPFQLSPVVYREDARHSFLGNPNLRPEYTDAFELTFQENKGWGSVQINPYVRHTAHAVRFIQRVDTTGVVVGTYDNVAAANDVGTDLNMTYRNGPLTLLTGGSAHHYQSDAANLAGNISIHASWWSTRANATWKFTPLTDLQLSANYRSPYPTEGGSQTALVFMNVALRRKLWGDQGSATLRVNDPFNLLSFGYRTGDGRVNEIYTRRFARGASISISRNFGQQLKLRPRQDPEVQGPPQPGG